MCSPIRNDKCFLFGGVFLFVWCVCVGVLLGVVCLFVLLVLFCFGLVLVFCFWWFFLSVCVQVTKPLSVPLWLAQFALEAWAVSLMLDWHMETKLPSCTCQGYSCEAGSRHIG